MDLDLAGLRGGVLDALDAGVMVLDLGSRLLFLNNEGERLLGARREELLERPILQDSRFYPFVLLVNEHRKEGPTLSRSLRQLPAEVTRKDGSRLPIRCLVSNLVDDQRTVQGYVIAFHDRSGQLELEARARRSESLASLGVVAAGVAHEIRGPLHALHSAAELIEHRLATGGDVGDYTRILYDEIAKLERLVDDVLEYSKGVELRRAPVFLGTLAQQTVERLNPPDDLALSVEVEEGLPVVNADADRLQQVLRNLVRNAVEAQPDGGAVRVKVLRAPATAPAGPGAPPGPRVELRVEDDGPGIAPEDQARLFEPFFSKRSGGRGTGLGLGICLRLIEAHDGAIEVRSALGEGSTFSIYLPLPVAGSVP